MQFERTRGGYDEKKKENEIKRVANAVEMSPEPSIYAIFFSSNCTHIHAMISRS